MNVLIFGHVCIDHNTSERAQYTEAGSPAMFMSKIFRCLPDISVTIVSHYGKDFLKYAPGIDIYPRNPRVDNTLVYHNNTRVRPRVWRALLRANSPPVELDEFLKSKIRNADILIFAPLLPNFKIHYIRDVIRLSRENSLKIILPQGYFRNFDEKNTVIFREFREAHAVLYNINFAILSEEDCPDAESLALKWIDNLDTTVIVTKAEKGATVVSRVMQETIPTKPVRDVEIVNSVGLGDVFAAGFMYKYFHAKDVIESVHFANRLAGECLLLTPDEIESNVPRILDKGSLVDSKEKRRVRDERK